MQVKPFGKEAEVLGGAINGLIHAINRENIMPQLEKLNMTDIQSDRWYPKQLYVDLWNAILETSDSAMFDLVSAGLTMANTAWPPEADAQSFDDLIEGWNDAFNVVNRGKDRGYVRAEKVNSNLYLVYCRTPDPDDLHYGIVHGFCKRFLPKGTAFTVDYNPDTKRRDLGGQETIIRIQLD